MIFTEKIFLISKEISDLFDTMGDQGGLPLNFHIRNFFTQLLDHSRDSSCYNDTTLVCKDKPTFINKVLLSLAFTSTFEVVLMLSKPKPNLNTASSQPNIT